MINNEFNVLDMAKAYADSNDVDVSDIFKKPLVVEEIKTSEAETSPVVEVTHKKPKWQPDAKLLEDLPESKLVAPVYNKDQLLLDDTKELKNIADDNALEWSKDEMDDLTRKYSNIEDAKKTLGIVKLQIPEGPYHVRIIAAAGDNNYKRAQEGIIEALNEIIKIYPFWILEWADKSKNIIDYRKYKSYTPDQASTKIADVQSGQLITDLPEGIDNEMFNASEDPTNDDNIELFPDSDQTKIIIDKSSLPDISWSEDEIKKIRKSRSIELNIVEKTDLEYNNIEDLDDNAVDIVLSKYQRKVNDVICALPASKYRATFTGLTYTEVLDLNNSQELNNLDGERKKWSIAFDHLRNQSIGNWEEYSYYIDKDTNKKIKLPLNTPTPPGVQVDQIRRVTKFDDFLMKTSFLDLEFMIWKILCATTMEKEIISIDCLSVTNGVTCNKTYDWIYTPTDLLSMEKINPAVLEEFKLTMEAGTIEEITNNYKSSMLCTNNTVKLPTSKIGVVFGHISAYDYLESIYSEIKTLEEYENDPELMSRALIFTLLPIIKCFLIPNEDNTGYKRIRGVKNMTKFIKTLDEIDWQTLTELAKIMIQPYQFEYAVRDIVCPKCKTRSNIQIQDITRLLFIVARSLSSVQVVLKKV